VIVESGTYQVKEEVDPLVGQCSNTNYEDGRVFIVDGTQCGGAPLAAFCLTLEGDCSGTIQAREEKACTVKNYLDSGTFLVPQTAIAANSATTEGTTTTQSNNALTSQSNNAIPTTTTTTQSSNAGGVPQSSNIVPSNFTSAPSSTLVNILPTNPN
jgi:hypothetical protein